MWRFTNQIIIIIIIIITISHVTDTWQLAHVGFCLTVLDESVNQFTARHTK